MRFLAANGKPLGIGKGRKPAFQPAFVSPKSRVNLGQSLRTLT